MRQFFRGNKLRGCAGSYRRSRGGVGGSLLAETTSLAVPAGFPIRRGCRSGSAPIARAAHRGANPRELAALGRRFKGIAFPAGRRARGRSSAAPTAALPRRSSPPAKMHADPLQERERLRALLLGEQIDLKVEERPLVRLAGHAYSDLRTAQIEKIHFDTTCTFHRAARGRRQSERLGHLLGQVSSGAR